MEKLVISSVATVELGAVVSLEHATRAAAAIVIKAILRIGASSNPFVSETGPELIQVSQQCKLYYTIYTGLHDPVQSGVRNRVNFLSVGHVREPRRVQILPSFSGYGGDFNS